MEITPSVHGFRVWRVIDSLLYSAQTDVCWPPKEWLHASCWPDASRECQHHLAPDDCCDCGIHLARTYADLEAFLPTIKPATPIFGCASGGGHILPSLQRHKSWVEFPDRGWRVEYARPSALFVSNKLDLAAIACRYDTPVIDPPADPTSPCPGPPG